MHSFWILGNQLSHDLADMKEEDVIVMIEATSRATWRPYHNKSSSRSSTYQKRKRPRRSKMNRDG